MNIQSAHVPSSVPLLQFESNCMWGEWGRPPCCSYFEPKGLQCISYRIMWMVNLHIRSVHSLAKVEFSNRIDNNNTNYQLSFLAAPLALFWLLNDIRRWRLECPPPPFPLPVPKWDLHFHISSFSNADAARRSSNFITASLFRQRASEGHDSVKTAG